MVAVDTMQRMDSTLTGRRMAVAAFILIASTIAVMGTIILKDVDTKGETATVVVDMTEDRLDEEYPFNTISQDWSDEDMEGFCYHEISDECKAAGGRFPVLAQIYTYIVCKKYGVDYEMVFALIEQESKCDWNASGDDGTSWGYMQVAPKWHKERMERLGCTNLTNPYQNILVGVDYLKEIQDNLQDIPEDVRPYYVLAAYNYGKKGAWQSLWSKDKVKYSYNTAIMERAAQLKAEKNSQETMKGE